MSDLVKVNLVAIAAVFLVLLLVMRNLILPVILVLTIETAIWINLAIPYFMDDKLFYIAYLLVTAIQLGATVDYAILMTTRYRENRLTMDKKTCVVETVKSVTPSILTSGIVMTVVGLLMGALVTHGIIAQLGELLGRGTICSVIAVLFVLPGYLYAADKLFVKKQEVKLDEK
jgi:predicted RND superfamily exporter protein